jgi:hypothetical protein
LGNRFVMEYRTEDSIGVDTSQAHERNRIPESRAANRYLKRVKYGTVASALVLTNANDWHFEVVFDYGEHPSIPPPDDNDDWLV